MARKRQKNNTFVNTNEIIKTENCDTYSNLGCDRSLCIIFNSIVCREQKGNRKNKRVWFDYCLHTDTDFTFPVLLAINDDTHSSLRCGNSFHTSSNSSVAVFTKHGKWFIIILHSTWVIDNHSMRHCVMQVMQVSWIKLIVDVLVYRK